MSMHFAPQWIKPIKPTGTSVTPTAESPNLSKAPASAQVPFPALSNSGASHSTVPSSSGLSYSRATHTPTTAGFPTDSSYFPYDESNGSRINGEMSHPFRYSRDHILGLWDEQKVSKMPIELVDMLEGGGVLASRDVVRPNGLRELSDIEKKVSFTIGLYRTSADLLAVIDFCSSAKSDSSSSGECSSQRSSNRRRPSFEEDNRRYSYRREGGYAGPNWRNCFPRLWNR